MELSSKSKFFGFKSKKPPQKLPSNWFTGNCLDDENENPTEFFKPAIDKSKTPVRTVTNSGIDGCNISPISCNSSPQFRVGWNEATGSQKSTVFEMSSPVSVLPTRRKIRRCPENLLSKISTPETEPTKKEEEGDILQYINWAKNLLESNSFQVEEENQLDNSITKITESIKDTNIDILDDSSNELMILCSQAIEEKVNRPNKSSEKHLITPDHDRFASKRLKKEEYSCKKVLKSVDNKLTNLKKSQYICEENSASKFNLEQYSEKKVNQNKVFRRPQPHPRNLNNFNNNNVSKPCLVHNPSKKVDLSLPSIPATVDDIKSHLDDEDDLFCSMDFNFLDSLQKKGATRKPETPNLSDPVNPSNKIDTLQLNVKPLVTKYSKEEIEKRRLEAKKRLLLKKKNRSM